MVNLNVCFQIYIPNEVLNFFLTSLHSFHLRDLVINMIFFVKPVKAVHNFKTFSFKNHNSGIGFDFIVKNRNRSYYRQKLNLNIWLKAIVAILQKDTSTKTVFELFHHSRKDLTSPLKHNLNSFFCTSTERALAVKKF